jgi:hypothetical protein
MGQYIGYSLTLRKPVVQYGEFNILTEFSLPMEQVRLIKMDLI